MKKSVPYIILGIIVILVAALIVYGSKNAKRTFDGRVTLRHKDKIPYGMSAAKTLLPSMFSEAAVYTDDKAPGTWNFMSSYSDNQAVIFVAKYFDADESELDRLLDFVKEGNHVFIISRTFSDETQKTFGFELSSGGIIDYLDYLDIDSIAVKLEKNSFSSDSVYMFPGKKYENWFRAYDTAHTVVLGRNAAGYPDFIQMKMGTGTISIHTVPIAFSNYFLLHKNNLEYFQRVLSVIPENVDKVVWDEYYLTKRNPTPKKPDSPLRVLFRYPPFKWGLLVAGGTLLFYLLMFMRRRQRSIPGYAKPKNDSLDFVKTMGRLYYDRKDHRNLALKMAVYFLEHVRTQFKLPTHTLDKEFEQVLHYKSNYPLEGVERIVSFIRHLRNNEAVSENQLAKFHSLLESFYKNT